MGDLLHAGPPDLGVGRLLDPRKHRLQPLPQLQRPGQQGPPSHQPPQPHQQGAEEGKPAEADELSAADPVEAPQYDDLWVEVGGPFLGLHLALLRSCLTAHRDSSRHIAVSRPPPHPLSNPRYLYRTCPQQQLPSTRERQWLWPPWGPQSMFTPPAPARWVAEKAQVLPELLLLWSAQVELAVTS